MIEKKDSERIEALMRHTPDAAPVRITTYIDEDLHHELMKLKKAGISITKVINKAVGDLLKKHGII